MEPLSSEDLVQRYQSLDTERKERISDLIKNESGRAVRKKRSVKILEFMAKGRLTFLFKDPAEKSIPLHHMHVELWDRDTGNPDDYLGGSITDENGFFEIFYDPDDAGTFDTPDLELRVFEERHRFDNNGNVRNKKKLIFSFPGADNVRSEVYDFGTCEIPYWEYDPEGATPRVLITEQGDPPQAYETGRNLAMVKIAPIEAMKRLHQAKDNLFSIDSVQNGYKAYKVNKTLKIEKKKPGVSRSDAYFGKCLLNGMGASIMDRDPENNDLFWIHFHWNSYEQDGIYAMPNIDIKLKLEGNILLPVEIKIGLRKKGEKNPPSSLEHHVVHPEDGEKWNQAKRIARVSSSLSAELDAHLCGTHLNGEQYAIAAYRNIRKNPVRYLLFPHLKEVCLVNNSANTLLLGNNGYITRSTGFTGKSINERIVQTMGTLDWKNWEPRKAISDKHLYSHATRLFWDVLTEYIDWYFSKYQDQISKEWYEIKKFSDDLIKNSVPEFLCQYLDKAFNVKSKNEIPWMDWNERMDIDLPRTNNGKYDVAVSEITNVSENPGKDDIDHLKQVCRYVIHHTTFVHSWSNSQQYDEGGELRFTSLGLRYGDNGLFVDEDDDSILPPPKDATMQLWISYLLATSTYGFILKNEERDIHPKFIELLKKRKAEFKAIHKKLDISKIPSRTNI